MTADVRGARPRVAVDANVLMDSGSLGLLVMAANRGLLEPVWSPQLVGELSRASLWRLATRGPGRRTITGQQYREYRELLYRRIHLIDLHFELARVAPTPPLDDELTWAEATDPDDLHVQLLARTAQANCVVSWNHRDFPGRQVVDGRPCGELCGVLWLTPDQLPSLRLPTLKVGA